MIRIDFNRLKFLIIDDNAHMRRIVRQLVHGFGSREIFEAEDGAAGLEVFLAQKPDIVITDWAMPLYDGIEFTKTVRSSDSPVTRFVPIIMLSGHSEKRNVIEARDAGVTEFLTKPVAAKSLYERILSVVLAPRPFIRTKDYFGPDRRRSVNAKYTGPERRKGGANAEVIEVAPIDNRLQNQRKQADAGTAAKQLRAAGQTT